MKVKKRSLLLIAGSIWTIAGCNILFIGLQANHEGLRFYHPLVSMMIFLCFWIMVFAPLVKKHTKRITSYVEETQWVIHFCDRRSFLIMAGMMTLGILIRTYQWMPELWIAVFYSGLGCALTLAGMMFFYQYIKYDPTQTQEVTL